MVTALNELHPVVQKNIKMTGRVPGGLDKICGCYFGMSPIYGTDVHLCRYHTGMSLGVDEALEWAEMEEEW